MALDEPLHLGHRVAVGGKARVAPDHYRSVLGTIGQASVRPADEARVERDDIEEPAEAELPSCDLRGGSFMGAGSWCLTEAPASNSFALFLLVMVLVFVAGTTLLGQRRSPRRHS